MEYLDLVKLAESEDIDIIDFNFKGNIKGLYYNKNIAISDKIETTTEKKCILAEELGHYFKNIGDITDPEDLVCRKQELLGRSWGFKKLVRLESIIAAKKEGIRNRYELAEYLDVTEKFLEESIDFYKSKYGHIVMLNNYIIDFDTLDVYREVEIKDLNDKK